MGVFSFPAVAIYDSTATGRSLITAADQAAARAAIGVDTSEYGFLDSDNTWTGDNTFDEPITAPELAGVSSLMLTAGGGSPTYFKFGTNLSWIVDTASIRPTDSIGSRDLGLYNRRIGDVMAYRFGATESMTIYKLGNETESTNVEKLETSFNDSNNYWNINSSASGSGTVKDIRISRDGDEGIWIDGSGIRFIAANSTRFNVQSGEIRMYKYLRSMTSASTIGSTTYPMPAVYSDLFSAGDGDTGTATPSIGFTNSPNMGFARASINQMNFIIDAARRGINIGRDNFGLTSNYALGWRSSTSLSSGTHDLTLHRDAAHTLAQRFGTNPQAFRVYGTWTDASNGEWLQIDYGVSNAGVATIQAYANGTGANGGLYLRSETNLRFYVGNILAHNISSTLDRMNVNLEPYFDNQKRLGSDVKRFTEVWSYDGNFSTNLTVGSGTSTGRLYLGETTTYIWRNGDSVYEAVNGYTTVQTYMGGASKFFHFNPIQNQDIDFKVSYDGGVGLFMDGATGNVSFGADVKLYNLGTDGDTNTEFLEIAGDSAIGYYTIQPKYTGTGNTSQVLRLLAVQGSHISLYAGGQFVYTHAGVQHLNCNSSGVQITDLDVSGTTTLRTFDDGAGNTSGVATQNSSNDSFFLHRTWTGTSGGASSWIGLKNDYNSAGTAVSWIGLSPNTFRLELGNGLRGLWQLSGNQHMLNMNIYPYTDNTWKNGTFNRAWSETWQHTTKTLGSYVDSSNYGYLSIEPDGDDYLIKANSLGTTADAGIKIQTSQKSAAGNQPIVLDADYNGKVSFYFGGNNRGFWSKDTLQPNVQVRTTVAYDINRIWNNATTVFEGYEANITDTTSDTESSLLNLKVGGTSYLRLRKNGDLLFEKQGGSARIVQNAGGIAILGDNGSTVQSFDQYFNYTYKTFRPISDNQHLGYVSRRFLLKANDIYSKGKIRSYNVGDETDANAEYLNLHWLSDHAYLTCEATGTGTARQFSIGTHTNGSIRFNQGSNTVRFSIGGVTATKAYLSANGLTVYGRVDPQGNKTRDLGTDVARWRVGYIDTCDLDDGRINQKTSSSSDPSTSEYANDGDWGMHENTSNGHIYLAFNDGGTIYKTQLHSGGGGGSPSP